MPSGNAQDISRANSLSPMRSMHPAAMVEDETGSDIDGGKPTNTPRFRKLE